MASGFKGARVARSGFGATLAAGLCLFCAGASAAFACDGRLSDHEHVLNAPVCIPEAPQRIVVLDPTYSLGMGLEIGLPIAGAPLFDMSDQQLKAKAKAAGVMDIGGLAAPSVETVIALQPDLIIGPPLAEPYLPMLSQLAPTALISAQDWKTYYRTLGDLTGQAEAVDQQFKAYEARLADIRPRIPQTEISILRITDWDFQVYLDGPNAYGPFDVLRAAGVARTAYETTDGEEVVKRPDWEELIALEGEKLLYIVGGTNRSDTSGRHEEVLGNPLWQMLPAVQSGQVYRVDPGIWMEFSGIGSAMRVLDDVERLIIDAP